MTALFWILAVLACADTVGAAGPCRDGWTYYDITKSCYAYFDIITDYFLATAYCNQEGGTIATPHTAEELQFVHSLRPPVRFSFCWLGLDDRKTEGTFVWQDGQPLQYDAWQDNRPVNDVNDNCVLIGPSPLFYDDYCFSYAAFVCQVPPIPDPCDDFTCENGECNSATGVAVCDCIPIFTGERCDVIKMATYQVTLFTPDVDEAGTDAKVVTIIGSNIGSAYAYFDGSQEDALERGKTDSFTLENLDVGSITRITVQHDNSGANPSWFLGYVTVRKYGASASEYVDYKFNCDCWLALDKGDGLISRTLQNPEVSSSA